MHDEGAPPIEGIATEACEAGGAYLRTAFRTGNRRSNGWTTT